MKTKSLNSYLPQKEPKDRVELLQGKVPYELKKKAKEILKAKRLTWDDLLIASLRKLIEEN